MEFCYETLKDNNERVGTYKGLPVYALSTYSYKDCDDMVFIMYDDGMKLVYKGFVVGIIQRNGSIKSVSQYRYTPKKKGAVVPQSMDDVLYDKHECMLEDKHTLAEAMIKEYSALSIDDLLA